VPQRDAFEVIELDRGRMVRAAVEPRRSEMKAHNALTCAAAAAALLLATTAAAQAPRVSIGGHGGLSVPNIRANSTDVLSQDFSSRQGPFFGMFVETGLSPRLSLVVDFNFTSQGGKRNGVQPITTDIGLPPLPDGSYYWAGYHNEAILDYLEVPVQLRVHFGTRLRFFVNGGPYIGILVRAKTVTSGSSLIYLDQAGTQPVTPSPVPFDAETDVSDSIRRTNFGVTGGGGFMRRLGRGDLVTEVRFQAGLTTIQRDVATSGNNKTGAVVVSVGYSLSLGK
jgi:hypothetical protein